MFFVVVKRPIGLLQGVWERAVYWYTEGPHNQKNETVEKSNFVRETWSPTKGYGFGKLCCKGEKPWLIVRKDLGKGEFNYNTSYTLCNEFWDMKDSMVKRRTVQALIKHRAWTWPSKSIIISRRQGGALSCVNVWTEFWVTALQTSEEILWQMLSGTTTPYVHPKGNKKLKLLHGIQEKI